MTHHGRHDHIVSPMMKPRLLSVARASAEVTAGIPGQCAVSVRVLDDVTLRIHAGELLLLQAPEALGQSMLLAALAGREHSPRHRYVRSVRDAAPGLRIRRAALHVDAVREIMRGWQEALVEATVPASRTLYLLRASGQRALRGGALTPREAAEWRRWGRHAHERRDGVVIACVPMAMLPVAMLSVATSHDHARQAPAVSSAHEPVATYNVRAGDDEVRTIRLLELRAGRLHTVRAPRRYSSTHARFTAADPALHPWSAGGGSDAQPPTASRPGPTASPEP